MAKDWTPGRFPGGVEIAPRVWRLRARTGERTDSGGWRQVEERFRGSKTAAQEAHRDLKNRIKRGELSAARANAGTVADVMAGWIEANTARWAPRTLKGNRDVTDRFIVPELGKVKIDMLSPATIDAQYVTWRRRKVGEPTLVAIHRSLHAALQRATRLEMIARNPASLVDKPHVTKTARTIPTIADLARAVAAADTNKDQRLVTLVRVAANTGARRGELAALRWCDVDLTAGTVTIASALTVDAGRLVRKNTKTNNRKVIALGPDTVRALKAYRASTAETFLKLGWNLTPTTPVWRQRGRTAPIYPDTISQAWRTLADSVGLTGVRFHDIRHAVASTLIVTRGRDPRTVADVLGQSSAKLTLDTYSHSGVSDFSRDDAQYLDRLLGS